MHSNFIHSNSKLETKLSIDRKVKSESESCSHVLLFVTPMDHTDHGTLQARILEWVAVPFSRGFSQPRDQTQVSHTAGRFFTS